MKEGFKDYCPLCKKEITLEKDEMRCPSCHAPLAYRKRELVVDGYRRSRESE